eukprot:11517020-Alexandrium_andersonii.AAC.1
MSASLVGSEMCIRDSSLLFPSGSFCSGFGTPGAPSLSASSKRVSLSCESVSYTHLTLPTICSV